MEENQEEVGGIMSNEELGLVAPDDTSVEYGPYVKLPPDIKMPISVEAKQQLINDLRSLEAQKVALTVDTQKFERYIQEEAMLTGQIRMVKSYLKLFTI